MKDVTPSKARPILFSGPMVRAILEGRKTQTRRVVKVPRALRKIGVTRRFYPGGRWWVGAHPGGGWWAIDRPDGPGRHFPHGDTEGFPCPYGVPGDRLWVRETHALLPGIAGKDRPVYRADFGESDPQPPWRPSIHMPRWASRLLLEVTEVRVERLQEITEEDAIAEGIDSTHLPLAGAHGVTVHHADPWPTPNAGDSARSAFGGLWDSINARRGHGWDENPWVWVVSFRRVRG